MIYLTLLVLAIITFIIFCVKFEDDSYGSVKEGGIVGFVIGIIVLLSSSIGTIGGGVSKYPKLVSEREGVLVYRKRLTDIKEAYYKEKQPTNALVGGSLTNIKQSSVVTEFISELTRKESCFNASLKKAQENKKIFLYYIIGNTMYVSKKIFEIEPL